MISIKKIDPPKTIVQSPDGEQFLVNEYEFVDLRKQIVKYKIEGWSVFSYDQKIMSEIYLNGGYDLNVNIFNEILEDLKSIISCK